ncbi:phosphoglycerate kinase [Candidatus Neptunichlamydia sp. REUL1]|uniref:phosphoglycerate kinase n=1 Tax=Candidatus Neptunichlamydia sp. REUL1 TaxID=3064277 RepID=UPI00292D7713|nr:phosphoglycerate kinase [Candidatus Neptunochlamydia sp. REUL1]
MKLSLQDLDIKGKKVLMRVDFNVPLNDVGMITNDARIQASLPSMEYVLAQGGGLILMCHFGRPRGKVNPNLSLRPVAQHLSNILERNVMLAPDSVGSDVESIAKNLQMGEVLLLENLRFHKGEEHPDEEPEFAENLAKLGDVYVDDAFGAAHRNHSSIVGITKFFPKTSAMGFLMEKEVLYLSQVVLNPKRPFYAIIGGAKVGSKLAVLNSLSQKIDGIFIGGGMSFTFFKAMGLSIGDSICDDEMIDNAKSFLKICEEKAIQIHLPKDLVVTNDQDIQMILSKDGVKKGWKGMDIGPQTVEEWTPLLSKGATIFWNGPMGVFEEPSFAHGTERLAQNLSMMSGDVIVGGGDSVAAISNLKLEKSFTHLSTGGGASLEFIEFGHLPGVDALTPK